MKLLIVIACQSQANESDKGKLLCYEQGAGDRREKMDWAKFCSDGGGGGVEKI